MRILFIGSAEYSIQSLSSLIDSRHDIVGVISQPDKPSGRKKILQSSPLKSFALNQGYEVFTPENISSGLSIRYIKKLKVDLIIVVAYGQFIPLRFINNSKYKAINVHPSLLPKYRGATPIQWSLINGDHETGVSIIDVSEELDAGDIYKQCVVYITKNDNYKTLHDKLATKGAELLIEVVNSIESKNFNKESQNKQNCSYVKQLKKSDGIINWNDSAVNICNKIRAFNPWPGSHCILPNNKKLIVWSAQLEKESGDPGTVLDDKLKIATPEGSVRLLEVQLEGGRRMSSDSLLNGHSVLAGQKMIFNNK